MTTTKLPELPEPLTRVEVQDPEYGTRVMDAYDDYYTADQLRAYGEACRAIAPAVVAGDLVEEGLAYFEAAGDAGDKQYVAAIRRALATRPAVPDGFVMVPVEPTEAMLDVSLAWCHASGVRDHHRWMYRQMLAAAPAPRS